VNCAFLFIFHSALLIRAAAAVAYWPPGVSVGADIAGRAMQCGAKLLCRGDAAGASYSTAATTALAGSPSR
jgi:hypothetical protein